MIIKMLKQLNPEHWFYIPYLQPLKASIQQGILEGKIKETPQFEEFVLPKVVSILADENGVESLFFDGQPVKVFTDITTDTICLLNKDVNLPCKKHIIGEDQKVIDFPYENSKKTV